MSKHQQKCEWCGKPMTQKEAELNDICTECVQGAADEIDRDMLGDESFEFLKLSGYLDDNTFGDK